MKQQYGSSENNENKKQEVEAKENEIEDAIENASDKNVKESKKEANVIGDSDREQLIDYSIIFDARI